MRITISRLDSLEMMVVRRLKESSLSVTKGGGIYKPTVDDRTFVIVPDDAFDSSTDIGLKVRLPHFENNSLQCEQLRP